MDLNQKAAASYVNEYLEFVDKFTAVGKYYGTDCFEHLVELLHDTIGSNAQSHIRGVASERRFKDNVLLLDDVLSVRKVPDNDYSKRYDFEVKFLVGKEAKTFTFEVKTAKKNGTFDVKFRDSREVVHCGLTMRTHLRRVDESFDFAAVNLVNVTERWDDIAIVPFAELPRLCTSKKGRVDKIYSHLPDEVRTDMEATYLTGTIHLDKVKCYQLRDLPNLLGEGRPS